MSYNRDATYYPPPPGRDDLSPPLPPRPAPPATGQYNSQGYDPRYNTAQPQAYPPQTSYNAPPASTSNYAPPLSPRETHPLYGNPHGVPQNNPPHGGYQMNPPN